MFKKISGIFGKKAPSGDISKLMSASSTILKDNISDLSRFASRDSKQLAKAQQDALKGLSILSDQVKIMMK